MSSPKNSRSDFKKGGLFFRSFKSGEFREGKEKKKQNYDGGDDKVGSSDIGEVSALEFLKFLRLGGVDPFKRIGGGSGKNAGKFLGENRNLFVKLNRDVFV